MLLKTEQRSEQDHVVGSSYDGLRKRVLVEIEETTIAEELA